MLGYKKKYGVVYTPAWVVDLVLKNCVREYNPTTRICDPACGDGAFLARVVRRICETLPANQCRSALENIVGMDIDAAALSACKKHLDATLKSCGKRLKIQWKLYCMDSANRASLAPFQGRFDYVIGNPPYVRIQHLGAARRMRLQRDWALAKRGSTDLYIAFFEIALLLLKNNGRVGYITPNTYVKTAAGQALRNFILARHGIVCLIDFGAQQVFQNATTYSLITVLEKNVKRKKFALYHFDEDRVVNKGLVSAAALSSTDLWILESEKTLREIARIRGRGRPLKEIADIHVGLQTLADNVFILNKIGARNNKVLATDMHGNEVQLETAVTRPILKASVMKNGRDTKERIVIFPYRRNKLLNEKCLQQQFPNAYRYLSRHKKILLRRDNGKCNPERWYAFGREFGLSSTFGDKLLTSGMNKTPNFQICPAPEYTFYAGYCVKPKANVNINDLLAALNSAEMEFYIRCISRDYQNGWKSYAKGFIQDYGVPWSATDSARGGQTSMRA